MFTLALLVICISFGALLRAKYSGHASLNTWARNWVIWIALPAMILRELPRMTFDVNALWLFSVGIAVFVGALIVIGAFGKLRSWSKAEIAAMILCAGLGNTSFVGLPVMRLVFGGSAVGPALVVDQSSFVALALGGTTIAAWGAGKALSVRQAAERILLFPPTVAALSSLALAHVGLAPFESFLDDALYAIAQTLSPVALFAVGLQFTGFRWNKPEQLAVGLTWKLVLAPFVILGFAAMAQTQDPIRAIGILQAGMPPMVTAAIVAESEGLEPELASQMVVTGLCCAALTLSLFSLAL